ncbi:nucleotide-binding protein [Actinosynnema sp. NPDC023658]|uniref:nucleotide-binding protein n=1 Tax=Actinosynnema sp. NPDC023658 TaxID=3155465 RepID=UPI0033C205B9
MARVPVEVLSVDDDADVHSAVALANAAQDEFAFGPADDDFALRVATAVTDDVRTGELFDRVEDARRVLRGYRPFVIAAVSSYLRGPTYENLFGAHRASEGIAVVTRNGVAGTVVPADRMAAYFLYFLARYSLSFLAPDHPNHHDSRACVFDRKLVKADIVTSMRDRPFCDACRRALVDGAGMLSPRQLAAVERLVALSGRILRDGVDSAGRPQVFVGSSSEGLPIARKVRELLSDEFDVTLWNNGTVFGLGESNLEALEAAVLAYHSGIFVFTPDDELTTRGLTRPVARDNVLFELGMFVGRLGRRRAFVLQPTGSAVSLPSDLAGITTAGYPADERDLDIALATPVDRIRRAVRAGRP